MVPHVLLGFRTWGLLLWPCVAHMGILVDMPKFPNLIAAAHEYFLAMPKFSLSLTAATIHIDPHIPCDI